MSLNAFIKLKLVKLQLQKMFQVLETFDTCSNFDEIATLVRKKQTAEIFIIFELTDWTFFGHCGRLRFRRFVLALD